MAGYQLDSSGALDSRCAETIELHFDDVGPAFGELLQLAQEHGFDESGCDPANRRPETSLMQALLFSSTALLQNLTESTI